MAKIKKQRKDNCLRQQGKSYAWNFQKEVSGLDQAVSKHLGIRQETILRAVSSIYSDLEYLCSLLEHPDPEFRIKNAVSYSRAVMALTHQLEFFLEDIAENDLSDDGEHVKVSEEEVFMMQSYSENVELAIQELEETCGIYLQNN